jgi:predicted HicB family RNase H-like nuclease
MKRVNIGLKEGVHTQAKIIAVLKTMTLNDYFARAIEKAVEKNQQIIKKLQK